MAAEAVKPHVVSINEPSRPKGPNLKFLTLVCFLSLVAGVISYFSYDWFIYAKTHVSTNNSYVEGDIWTLNSRIMGYIKKVAIKENQRVTVGDLVLDLDDKDLLLELKYKEARFKKAKADLERAHKLGAALVSNSDLEGAQAVFTASEADLEGTQLKMEFTHVTAPVSGVVGKLALHPGQFVQPGQNLTVIIADSPFWVKANFKETQLRGVQIGSPVEVKVDAYPGEIWRGRVESIFPSSGSTLSLLPPENATGNFTKVVQRIPVNIKIEEKPNLPLRPGMSTISTILLK